MAVLGLAVAVATGRLARYHALDASLLVQLGATALASLAGLVTAGAVGPPSDPLHLVYGFVATALPIGVRVWAQGRPAASLGRWVAFASLITLGVTVRSFMTGN